MKSIFATILAAVLITSSCQIGPTTPPAPAAAELGLYQFLIAAQATLAGAAQNESNSYISQYKSQINLAITSYNAMEGAFVLYAQAPTGNLTTLTTDEANLASEITQLIIAFTTPLDATQAAKMQKKFAAHASSQFDLSTFLSYLQIAASVAASIPSTAQWASLAQIVLQIAQSALTAETSVTTVDLTQLHTLAIVK